MNDFETLSSSAHNKEVITGNFGCFTPSFDFRFDGILPKHLQKLPLLRASFETGPIKPDLSSVLHVGQIKAGATAILIITLQYGPHQFHAFCNAADPLVWATVDQWHKAGAIGLVFSFSGMEESFISWCAFPPKSYLEKMRKQGSHQTSSQPPFLNIANQLIASHLHRLANSGFEEYPLIATRHGTIISTSNTLPVDKNTGMRINHTDHPKLKLPFMA